jgi:hypothetical protein
MPPLDQGQIGGANLVRVRLERHSQDRKEVSLLDIRQLFPNGPQQLRILHRCGRWRGCRRGSGQRGVQAIRTRPRKRWLGLLNIEEQAVEQRSLLLGPMDESSTDPRPSAGRGRLLLGYDMGHLRRELDRPIVRQPEPNLERRSYRRRLGRPDKHPSLADIAGVEDGIAVPALNLDAHWHGDRMSYAVGSSLQSDRHRSDCAYQI